MRRITFPRKIYNYFNKESFKSSMIMSLASLWLVCLRLFGKSLGLESIDGSLTFFAHIISWPVVFISIMFIVLKNLAEKYDEESKVNGQAILSKLLDSVNDIAMKKSERFCDYVVKNSSKTNLSPFQEITQPTEQLKLILNNIQITLSEIFGINRDNLSVSLIYWQDTALKWAWLAKNNIKNDFDVEEIVGNQHSTAYMLINSKKNSIFHVDKLAASVKNEYILSDRDNDIDNVGSIVCREIKVGNPENPNIRAILSVSTYGKFICDPSVNLSESMQKIQYIIMPQFEPRIQLELALLYMKEVIASKNP